MPATSSSRFEATRSASREGSSRFMREHLELVREARALRDQRHELVAHVARERGGLDRVGVARVGEPQDASAGTAPRGRTRRRARDALHQQPVGVVGELQHLRDAQHGADPVQVVGPGCLDGRFTATHIRRSARSTASISFCERSVFTSSGESRCGKSTVFLSGSTGSSPGSRARGPRRRRCRRRSRRRLAARAGLDRSSFAISSRSTRPLRRSAWAASRSASRPRASVTRSRSNGIAMRRRARRARGDLHRCRRAAAAAPSRARMRSSRRRR